MNCYSPRVSQRAEQHRTRDESSPPSLSTDTGKRYAREPAMDPSACTISEPEQVATPASYATGATPQRAHNGSYGALPLPSAVMSHTGMAGASRRAFSVAVSRLPSWV